MDMDTKVCFICNEKLSAEVVTCDDVCNQSAPAKCVKISKTVHKALQDVDNLNFVCDHCRIDSYKAINAKLNKILSVIYIYDERVTRNENNLKRLIEKVDDVKNLLNEKAVEKSDKTRIVNSSGKKAKTYEEKVKMCNNDSVIMVKPKDNQNSSATENDLKKMMDPTKINVNKWKKLPKGCLAIECVDATETEKVKNLVHETMSEKYVVSVPDLKNPRIKITGITDQLSDDELVNTLKQQNIFLANSEIKVINMFETKSNERKTAILEVDSKSFEECVSSAMDITTSTLTALIIWHVEDVQPFRHSTLTEKVWIMTVRVYNGGVRNVFTVVYFSPNGGKKTCIEYFDEWCNENIDSAERNIVAGDFNVDFLKYGTYQRKLKQIIDGLGMKQYVKSATRITELSKTKIDLVVSNVNVETVVLLCEKVSDHSTIEIKVEDFLNKREEIRFVQRLVNYSADSFRQSLSEYEWKSVADLIFNEKVKVLSERIYNCIQKFVKTVKQNKRNCNVWFDSELTELRRKRDSAYARAVLDSNYRNWAASIDCDLEPKNNIGRLKKSLLCKYDKSAHPSVTDSAVTVSLKMILKGFVFDDHGKVLYVSSWLSMQWKDDNLKWTPAEFNGITDFVESSENVWQPDLQLFNSDLASVQTSSCKTSNCLIASSGQVSCIPPCLHSARCAGDFSAWPFDTQNCTMHVGTWINAADEIDFKVSKTVIPESDLESQDMSWKLIKVTYMRRHGNYSTTKQYPSVMFSFLLERHSSEQAAVFLVPALIMASVNLITLWLSPEMSHRLMLLIFNILSHFIYMQQISWYVPSNGDICPNIVLCFRDSLIISGFLLINTIVVRGLSSCGLDVPTWIGSTTGFMGSNKFGQVFLSKSYLIDRQPLHSEEEGIDVNVSEPQTIPTVTIKPPTTTWALFAKFVDRVLFIIVLVLYIFMYILLMPKGYTFGQPRGPIEIVGN
ncbi:Neuronal acetylcholine receptor subunit alpha-7 [Pseudolycoriella hygida]|uniref:Neuronal acetylcholine receptor subunit alpha-7 n=1 Tax=Pseudolycoriella hygida TaxID=35572 RepID=A0A9Q0S8I6_9DIPT|nr:Neuronal acetylcholine receptor subunit alpha-7 [Pseudolycoriella hygida]